MKESGIYRLPESSEELEFWFSPMTDSWMACVEYEDSVLFIQSHEVFVHGKLIHLQLGKMHDIDQISRFLVNELSKKYYNLGIVFDEKKGLTGAQSISYVMELFDAYKAVNPNYLASDFWKPELDQILWDKAHPQLSMI